VVRRLLKFQVSEFFIGKFRFRFYDLIFTLAYITCFCWCFFWGWVFESDLIRDILMILPAIFLCYIHGTVAYAKNDFKVFQNVSQLNKTIDAANKDLRTMLERGKVL
jgi:hypothetical protein